jgi:hypothetical protein
MAPRTRLRSFRIPRMRRRFLNLRVWNDPSTIMSDTEYFEGGFTALEIMDLGYQQLTNLMPRIKAVAEMFWRVNYRAIRRFVQSFLTERGYDRLGFRPLSSIIDSIWSTTSLRLPNYVAGIHTRVGRVRVGIALNQNIRVPLMAAGPLEHRMMTAMGENVQPGQFNRVINRGQVVP